VVTLLNEHPGVEKVTIWLRTS